MKTMYFYILIACVFVIGCPQKDEMSMSSKGKRFVTVSNFPPCKFKNIRIHAGNPKMFDYTNNAGEKKHGWVASLTLRLIDRTPSLIVRLYVHPGQTIKWHGYSIYIEEIRVTEQELKEYKEILRKSRNLSLPPPPGIGFGSVIIWVKRDG